MAINVFSISILSIQWPLEINQHRKQGNEHNLNSYSIPWDILLKYHSCFLLLSTSTSGSPVKARVTVNYGENTI